MKVELEIPAEHLGETVVDLFKSLGDDSKKHIAEKVMAGFLEGGRFTEMELAGFRQQAIADVRRNDNRGYGSFDPDDYYYKPKIAARIAELQVLHGASRVALAKGFAAEVHAHFSAEVKRLVAEDPEIQAAIKATVETVKELFPKYVHDAMLAYFSGQMGAVMQDVQTAMMAIDGSDQRLQLLEQKLKA